VCGERRRTARNKLRDAPIARGHSCRRPSIRLWTHYLIID
jgi:hypothetical protein